MRAMTVGGGGAAAVVADTGCSRRCADGWEASMKRTVGAPHRCVTPSSASSRQTVPGSISRRQTCRPAAAVTAHGKHHPLQWNIGSVHRYTELVSRRAWCDSASALR
jgi:hypothetical protein